MLEGKLNKTTCFYFIRKGGFSPKFCVFCRNRKKGASCPNLQYILTEKQAIVEQEETFKFDTRRDDLHEALTTHEE